MSNTIGSASRSDVSRGTIGGQFTRAGVNGVDAIDAHDSHAPSNDLVVPSDGCHALGFEPADSLRIAGPDAHHHGYSRIRGYARSPLRGSAEDPTVGPVLFSVWERDDSWVRAAGARSRLTSKEEHMGSNKIIAIVLIVAGVLGLAYGSFTYTKETHDAKVGPIEFSVKDKETVNIPVWAGVGAIVIGAGLLLAGGRRA
jgi:hypothetical protein